MIRVAPVGVLLLAAAPAHATPGAVQVGNHITYGRIIIELSSSAPVSLAQHGDELELSLPGQTVKMAPRLPRNVLAFVGGQDTVKIRIVTGTQVRSIQTGRYFTIDILDPARPAQTASRTKPSVVKPTPSQPAIVAPPMPVAPAADTAAKPEDVLTAPRSSSENHSAEASVSAPSSPINKPAAPQRIPIPAGPEVGAVAFRRGDMGVVVFDDRVELKLIEGDPLAGRLTVQQMQGATIMIVPLAEGESLVLTRDADGWVVNLTPNNATAVVQTQVAEGIAFQFGQPGRALTISDPLTGQTLLLGTLRQPGTDHTVIDTRRSATGYVLLPTWLGLALEVTSDSVDLRASQSGFTLQIPDRAAPGTAVAAIPDNQFGLPISGTDILFRRLDAQIASAALSPPRSRGEARVAAARTMLALGMAAEAQALLSLAANDDPTIAADPTAAALSGIAAVLAHRPTEAAGLDNPNLPANGDVALWRSLRDVEQGKPPSNLGSFWPTLARYPLAVRQRVGPTVIEAAIDSGSAIPVSELEGSAFAIARAMQKQKSGAIDPALEEFDAITNQRNERDSVRAAVAATELRLSSGKITPATAADQIERQTVRWRGNGLELAMRLRVAELRSAASQWRLALESLRQTEALFPEMKERVAAMKSGVFTQLLAAKNETLNPLEVVTIAGDFADCIPEGKDGERLAGLLAEKLVALDLPSRAIPVLQHLLDTSTSPAAKGEFAIRLAALQLDANDPAKAESILASIDPEPLSQPEAEKRLLLLARARAGRGDPAGAATLLSGLDTPGSDEMRAAFLAKAGDWEGSLRALQKVAATAIPENGDLSEQQQDILLREATAAVQANNMEALRDLKRFDSRMKPPRADVFRLLTANAVESLDDLPRAARELRLSQALPERFSALKLR